MSGAYSRTRPWPNDAEIDVGAGWVGLQLVPGEDGLLVARKEEPLAGVTPTSYEYGSADPSRETTFPFGPLTGGMGEHTQSGQADARYRYAIDVDCSIGGRPRLGPEASVEAFPAFPGGASEVVRFVKSRHGSTETLFALVGRCVYRRTGGVWVLSKDFGAFNLVAQADVYQSSAANGGLWVTTVFGELWLYDGVNWFQSLIPGPATAVTHVGQQMIAAAGSVIRVTTPDTDPLLAASWSGPSQIGDSLTNITAVPALADTFFVVKEDGIYSTTTTGTGVTVDELFPEFRAHRSPDNGKNAVAWRGAVRLPMGDGYYALSAAGDLDPIGPERMVENDSEVRGVPVSGSGHADWFFYLGVYNATTGASYLLKHGTWVNPDADGVYAFADVWNGAIKRWPAKRLTRLDVVHLEQETNPILWAGFADGTVERIVLPVRTPDPANDPACRYIASGRVYWPLHHAERQADVKAFHGFTVAAPRLSATTFVRQFYRTDPTLPYATLAPDFTVSGQRVELPDGVFGVVLDAATALVTTDPAQTPILEAVALHEAVRTFRLEWSFTARAADDVGRRDGSRPVHGAERVRATLRAAAASPGHVRLRLPDETVGSFAQVQYSESLAPNERRHGPDYRVGCRFVQFR